MHLRPELRPGPRWGSWLGRGHGTLLSDSILAPRDLVSADCSDKLCFKMLATSSTDEYICIFEPHCMGFWKYKLAVILVCVIVVTFNNSLVLFIFS